MSNPIHLKVLQRGIKTWNVWREENPETRPDLSDANRTHAYLSHANLSQTDLRGAILFAANLAGADFEGADLSGANLLGAIGLAQKQIDSALGDDKTMIPLSFRRPAKWKKPPEHSPSP